MNLVNCACCSSLGFLNSQTAEALMIYVVIDGRYCTMQPQEGAKPPSEMTLAAQVTTLPGVFASSLRYIELLSQKSRSPQRLQIPWQLFASMDWLVREFCLRR